MLTDFSECDTTHGKEAKSLTTSKSDVQSEMGLRHEYSFEHNPEGLGRKEGSWRFSQGLCFVVDEEAEGIISGLAEKTATEVGVSYREYHASNQYTFAKRCTLLLQTKPDAVGWLSILHDTTRF